MKRFITIAAIIAALCGSAQAQESILPRIVETALSYIATNGTVSTGWDINADGSEYGVLLSQSVSISRLRVQLRKTEVVPGLQHSTLFQTREDAPDRDLLGVNLLWHWFDVPPWGATLQEAPVVRSVIWPKLFREWRLKPSLNYRSDKLVQASFNWRGINFGIEAAYRF